MEKTNLKLTILVDNKQAYFGAPVFYSSKESGDGTILIFSTEIGNVSKQKIEIQLMKPTFIEPVTNSESEIETTEK